MATAEHVVLCSLSTQLRSYNAFSRTLSEHVHHSKGVEDAVNGLGDAHLVRCSLGKHEDLREDSGCVVVQCYDIPAPGEAEARQSMGPG